MFPIIGAAIKVVGGIANNYLERKKIESKGKIDIAKARIEQAKTRTEGDIKYDQTAAEGMKQSCKDEFWTLIFGAIVIACFIPDLAPYVKSGFGILKTDTPEWFKWAMCGSIAASFGLRGFTSWRNGKK